MERIIMGVLGFMHTYKGYNMNFTLKLFTNHVLLCFLYFQIINNQRISAKYYCLYQLAIEDLPWLSYKEEDGHPWDGFMLFYTMLAVCKTTNTS